MSLFVDGANGDLHLDSSADAAIDQGTSLTPELCSDDVDGQPRPMGSLGDIGADEFNNADEEQNNSGVGSVAGSGGCFIQCLKETERRGSGNK